MLRLRPRDLPEAEEPSRLRPGFPPNLGLRCRVPEEPSLHTREEPQFLKGTQCGP